MYNKNGNIIILILIFICFNGFPVLASSGDLDEDGGLTSLDFTIMTRYIIGSYTDPAPVTADLDNDDIVNSMDHSLMRRFMLGSVETFPDGYYLMGNNSYEKLEISEIIGPDDVMNILEGLRLTTFNGIVSISGEKRVVHLIDGEIVLESNRVLLKSNETFEAILYQYGSFYENYVADKKTIKLFSIDNKVKLDIYSDSYDEYLKERRYVEMGEIVEVSLPRKGTYSVYASKENYYSELYTIYDYGEINVELKEANGQSKVTGVIFGDGGLFSVDRKIIDCQVQVYKDDSLITEFRTDENGIYSCNLDNGDYRFEFSDEDVFYTDVTIDEGYEDIYTDLMVSDDKPNIYLYPEEEVILDVELDFHNGGSIVKSIPEYGDGWHDIVVEPDGTINGKYSFLFYEGVNLDFSQYEYGWVVEYGNLEEFFRNNLEDYGFRGQEIEDFIEYWVEEEHLSDENNYYAIYPQLADEIEEEIVLNISQKPDSILRLIYTFVGLDDPDISIKEPEIEPFDREGFVVTEWGGILK
ncbi:MAG: dockerin type I repeat-containing protein [Halanaerobiaceae bacterium]